MIRIGDRVMLMKHYNPDMPIGTYHGDCNNEDKASVFFDGKYHGVWKSVILQLPLAKD